MVLTNGVMAEFILDNFKMIKNMDMEYINGSMAAAIMATGIEINNMAQENTYSSKRTKLNLASGKMEKEQSGLTPKNKKK